MSKYDKPMIETAIVWSNMSSCVKAKVGCVIAINEGIVSNGYNGTISGQPNICEDYGISCPKCNKIHIVNEIGTDMHTINCDCGAVNHFTSGWLEENSFLVTNEFTLHAEQNAILKAAKLGISINNATLYVTMAPCKTCAKLIAQAGIKRVVYLDKYKDMSGVEFLNKLGIAIEQYIQE